MEWDIRKAYPYLGYDRYDFEIPVGEHGDCYDRYLVRMEEMRQSVRIIEQALQGYVPDSPLFPEDPQSQKVFLPPKERVLTKMEELIHQFIVATEGPKTAQRQRDLLRHRGAEGGAGLLPRGIGHERGAPVPLPEPLLREPPEPPGDGEGPDGRGRGGYHRLPGSRDGGMR